MLFTGDWKNSFLLTFYINNFNLKFHYLYLQTLIASVQIDVGLRRKKFTRLENTVFDIFTEVRELNETKLLDLLIFHQGIFN